MDHRDTANHCHLPYTVDEGCGRIALLIDEEDGETEISLVLEWEVCSTCDGNGKHVNPSIDAHGLTAGDFAEDPDFAEDYFNGIHDVECHECHGRRVVATSSDPRFLQAVSDAWSYAAEDCHALEMGY